MMLMRPTETGARLPIQTYGNGAFQLEGFRHEGSVLLLPDRAVPWDVATAGAIAPDMLVPLLLEAGKLDFCLLGTGPAYVHPAAELRRAFRNAAIGLEAMATPAACRTYNSLIAEDRAFAAALIAVD